MAEPDPDKDSADLESMFDFLDDRDERRPFGRPAAAADTGADEPAADTVAARARQPVTQPVIRAPVPVSESGPLRAPQPGQPIQIPVPYETGGMRVDQPRKPKRPKRPEAAVVAEAAVAPQNNVTPFPRTVPAPKTVPTASPDDVNDDVDDDFAFLERGAAPLPSLDRFEPDEFEGVHYADESTGTDGRLRGIVALIGVGCLLLGAGLALKVWVLDPQAVDVVAAAPVGISASSSLGERFKASEAEIEGLLAQGQVEQAAAVIDGLDRSVFGYGAVEFGAIEARIATWRSSGVLPPSEAAQVAQAEASAAAQAERIAEERRVAAEAERLVTEQLAAAEVERVAEEQRAAADAARLAARQQVEAQAAAEAEAEAEAERAAQEAERAVADRRAAEQQAADAAEAERLASEQRVAAAAERLVAERRAAAQRAAAEAEAEAARLAQERQLAEEQAAADRTARAAQARQDRADAEARVLAERAAARDRRAAEAELAAQRAAVARADAERAAAARAEAAAERLARADLPTPAPAPVASGPDTDQPIEARAIGDSDLQTVYGRFASLEAAIEEGDITGVTRLTQPSPRRVQQFLQLFENSRSIDARITGVSTSRATGAISGTLRIRSIERNDGSRIGPPDDLTSITLTSRRSGAGWSTIDW